MLPQKATTVEEAITDYHKTLLPIATSYGKTHGKEKTYKNIDKFNKVAETLPDFTENFFCLRLDDPCSYFHIQDKERHMEDQEGL